MISTGLNAIDSLLGDYAWTQIPRTPSSVTYSFMVYIPSDLSAEDLYGLTQMTSVQKAATMTALASWEAVANISFSQVSESSNGYGGQIRFSDNNQGNVSAAYTVSSNNYVTLIKSYIFLNSKSYTNSNFRDGSYGLDTLVHEIGHALGLKHPGNYNAGGGGESPPYLPTFTDNLDYTIMSYNDGTAQTSSYMYPDSPMLYDIQAIQYLYGANMTCHTGNDTYSFTNTSIPLCVWDAGGINTFDFSACTNKVVINLNDGNFSQTRPGVNNVSIAYGVHIQQAVAGSGGSTIYCNNLADIITGGSGNDLIVIGTGSSTFDGGSGTNTLQMTEAAHDISLDTISHVQILDMNNQTTTMRIAELSQFQSFLNTAGGITFADSGNITAKTAVSNYNLSSEGPNNLTLPTLSDRITVSGGYNIDTLFFNGSAMDYTLAQNTDGSYRVASGNYDAIVTNIERIQTSDIKVAVDLIGSGHAAETVEIIGAAFGKENILPTSIGVGLALFDSGLTVNNVCQLVLTTDLYKNLTGSTANRDFVNLVYKNVTGFLPSSVDLAYFVGLMQGSGGYLTQADLLESAAFSVANQTHINLVGLQSTGVVYV